MILKLLWTKEKFLRRVSAAVFCLIPALLLTGCKEREELAAYRADMEQFYENVKSFDSSINALDTQSETAVAELLALLDSMAQSFSWMADLEVPEDFPGVEQLADEAGEYMTQAVTYYHQAFGAEYDPALADTAKQHYDLANERIQYILSILRGDAPDALGTYEQPESANE